MGISSYSALDLISANLVSDPCNFQPSCGGRPTGQKARNRGMSGAFGNLYWMKLASAGMVLEYRNRPLFNIIQEEEGVM